MNAHSDLHYIGTQLRKDGDEEKYILADNCDVIVIGFVTDVVRSTWHYHDFNRAHCNNLETEYHGTCGPHSAFV